MSEPTILYVTTADRDEARKIGGHLVKEKLCACVNILDGMESVYWWDGELQYGSECVLLVKTLANQTEEITLQIKKLHSYDVPCVVSLPLTPDAGNSDYLNWIRQSVGDQANNS